MEMSVADWLLVSECVSLGSVLICSLDDYTETSTGGDPVQPTDVKIPLLTQQCMWHWLVASKPE